MPAQVLTPEDLKQFKAELITEMKKLIGEQTQQPVKRWLRTAELKKILEISAGTLQNLRLSGKLPYTKIGGVIFYDFEEVQKLLKKRI